MAVFEALYIVVATLWNVLLLVAACFALRYVLKVRARRRRMNQLVGRVRLPMQRATGPYRTVATGALLLQQLSQQLAAGLGSDPRRAAPTPSRGRRWPAPPRGASWMVHRRVGR